MDAITINGLSKQYNKKYAIENVSLQVAEGEIFGFIGPNGAGKSTTIKVLLNFIKPDAGQAAILDEIANKQPKRSKRLLGMFPVMYGFIQNDDSRTTGIYGGFSSSQAAKKRFRS